MQPIKFKLNLITATVQADFSLFKTFTQCYCAMKASNELVALINGKNSAHLLPLSIPAGQKDLVGNNKIRKSKKKETMRD